jgi:hypothetical protein
MTLGNGEQMEDGENTLQATIATLHQFENGMYVSLKNINLP